MTPESIRLLLRGGEELALDLSPHVEAFTRLLALLQEGAAQTNLTALRGERDIILKHFVDSLTCLRGGWLDGEWRVLDLGTGAGFPALPLAIVRPELRLIPMDATAKKIAFVTRAAAALDLSNVTPLTARAETLGRDPAHREGYDRVVTRAVASLPALAELALPLLREGGVLVAQKGPISTEELEAGRLAAAEVGGEVRAVDAFALPVLGEARTLVVVGKVGPTPGRYPRREGVPARKPLFWRAT